MYNIYIYFNSTHLTVVYASSVALILADLLKIQKKILKIVNDSNF